MRDALCGRPDHLHTPLDCVSVDPVCAVSDPSCGLSCMSDPVIYDLHERLYCLSCVFVVGSNCDHDDFGDVYMHVRTK